MIDDLQKAYSAYQQALYHLPNPKVFFFLKKKYFNLFCKDPNLWYGIGILYDRYGSLEHAEEAFTAVLKMDSKFEKSNEIYFRLGIIYKQQHKYEQALEVIIFYNLLYIYIDIYIFFSAFGLFYKNHQDL